jgi:hypothetical protein
MAKQKDPAFLFYPTEFMLECSLMPDDEVGKYIKVFCNFFAHGHLSEKEIESVCGGHYDSIFGKLKRDDKGLYYHLRMDHEIERRKGYVGGRVNNFKGGNKKAENKESSFDTDEFFGAALERSERALENKEKKA